jgi:tRNA modification GTPase
VPRGDDDTIVAIATPPGRGALAIVRASGPRAHPIGRRVVQPWPSAPATACLASVRDPRADALIDRVVVTIYNGPRSFTGEDMFEISGHGGALSPAAVAAVILEQGARQAEPGEFTRRAVLNGKLDLLQAEGIADVVDARTEAARRASLHELDGGLSRRILGLRASLLDVEALVAYDIDFPEEDDGPVSPSRIAAAIGAAQAGIAHLLGTSAAGEVVREGARVVIAGRPNVGKSSLLNALLGYRRAIVSEVPGTTRDAIEAVIEGDRWPLRLVDTAGLRESSDAIEREGVAVSRRYLEGAHMVLVCDDDAATLGESCGAVRAMSPAPILAVLTKVDLVAEPEPLAIPEQADAVAGVSAVTRDGLAGLVATAQSLLDERLGTIEPDAPVLMRARHRGALEEAAAELAAFEQEWRTGELPMAVAAVHVRSAVHALESLVGAVDVEDVLSRVFATFCIGK